MSNWTHINGIITVTPFGRTQHEKRYILETILDHLPQITGSEGNVNIHVIQKAGYDHSRSHDELDVLSKHSTVRNKDDYFNLIQLQDEYILVLEGDFRDREFNETMHEFNKFMNRLAKRLMVMQILVEITDETNKYTFNDAEPYYWMYEDPSWCNKDSKPAWWEYLAWVEE